MAHLQQRLTLAACLALLAGVQRASAGVAYYGTAAQAQQLLPHSASVVLVPQGSTANLASVSSAVPVVYVGGAPGPGVGAVLLRDGAEGGTPEGGAGGGAGGGIVDAILSWFPHIPIINPAPSPTPVEGSKPEKVENPTASPPVAGAQSPGEASSQPAAESPAAAPMPARLEDLDEGLPPAPAERPSPGAAPLPLPLSPLSPRPGQKFVLVGQPQFFGNYDVLRQLGIQNIGTRGALLPPGVALTPAAFAPPRHLGGKPAPEKVQQRQQEAAPVAAADAAADSAFQRYSQQGALLSQRLRDIAAANSGMPASDDSGSSSEEKPSDNEDAEQVVGAEPPGPSVAQVKPQALALAGPGGVAAAAPLGTALVGPGGLAVAAPAATAIAGPAGGTPPIGIVPASQTYKQYLEAQKAVQSHNQQQQRKQNRRPAFIAYNA